MDSKFTTLSDLLASLRGLGVGIRVKGAGKDARLSVSAPSGVLDDAMKAAIAEWRPELLSQFAERTMSGDQLALALTTAVTPGQLTGVPKGPQAWSCGNPWCRGSSGWVVTIWRIVLCLDCKGSGLVMDLGIIASGDLKQVPLVEPGRSSIAVEPLMLVEPKREEAVALQ